MTATGNSAPKSRGKPSTDERPRDRAREIPDDVRKRFTQVGNQYFFPDGTRAFTDRGGRITSPSENSEVIRSLVAIAEARGWSDLIVKGTERFRREAWSMARQAGLEVRGYRPSAYDEARLARSLARSGESRVSEGGSAPSEGPSDPTRSRQSRGAGESARRPAKAGRSRTYFGRLADHGAAPYRHDPQNGISYFVRLETPDGEREIWGVDLNRALKESLTRPQIGDEVGLRAVRRDAVTLQAPTRDNEGKIIGSERLSAHRNRWILEQRRFFAKRAEAARVVRDPQVDPKKAVKGHPELAGTYLKIRASELAAKAIRDPEDRSRFVATVRVALADEVARGEPLTPVRLRVPAQTRKTPRALEPDRAPAR
jgi:putative DNA primase/helicase